jgi:hypothetical protein
MNKTLAAADSSASGTVQNLKLVHQARLSQLTRTAVALKAKYGATDSRTVAAETAVTAQSAAVSRIAVAGQQAATPAPTVAAGGWVLHGRVFGAELQPFAQYTVYLVNSQKAYQAQYGFAYTDDSGYFLIPYSPAAGQGVSTAGPLYVAIVDDKAQPVYLGTASFQPSPGKATYQNIALAAGDKPLGDPPAAIRQVAVPPQTKSS